MTPDAALDWSLVIPLKVLAEAKSRLTVLTAVGRPRLALAMAADTVAAAVAAAVVRTVLVITDDTVVGAEMERLGALILADEPAAGLNEALTFGAGYAREHWPERGVAALAGDLPALRPRELTTALGAVAPRERAFVPDADGTGTTLYAAAPGSSFEPLFGVGSASRHRVSGAEELAIPASAGLRRDVDTADDLRRAAEIGLGPRTTALLATVSEW